MSMSKQHAAATSSSTEGASMDAQLFDAAISGSIAEMQHLVLREGPDILLGTTSEGNTCLHISSIFYHLGFSMAALVHNKPLLSIGNSYGETPLIVAVKSGHAVLAGKLIDECMMANLSEMIIHRDLNGDTALHHAIRHGHKVLALQLINTEPNLSRMVNIYNESPMYIAVMRGFNDVFELLMEINDSSHNGAYGDNILHAAVRNGNLEVVAGTSRSYCSRRVGSGETGQSGSNGANLHTADWRCDGRDRRQRLGLGLVVSVDINQNPRLARGRTRIVETILQSRPALAREINKSGHTPIQYAVCRNQTSVIKIMLQHDRSLGYLVDSSQEDSPLLVYAASRGNIDAAQEILVHCPDARYCNGAGLTILHQAVIEGHVKFVQFVLLNRQLNKLINMRDNNGRTALHHAVRNCNPKIVRALLDHPDIDVRIYDNEGRPAFWQLIEAKDSEKSLNWIEVFMLMSKADPQATSFYVRQIAMDKKNEKSKNQIKSLTTTYRKTTSLVAILIAVLTFASAFSLPGGYRETEGLPVMARKPAFKAFLISDTLAMCTSLAVVFICILTRWEGLEFLLYYRSVTQRLMWYAYITTTVAFATGIYTVVAPQYLWLAILIVSLSVSVPFLTYLIGNWPELKLRYRLGSVESPTFFYTFFEGQYL
ncbi:Ankyrin repeat-containing protein [Rhynchospora pubera]|uniref:Ankyrin repeat-containing protein n=1 Tax=Rhynchospora pubera TaxID=906938 RepID=A0AAV8DMV9_9POAL|nr:Ankyrin repeat-containing protein [Rhynchospora pubera]